MEAYIRKYFGVLPVIVVVVCAYFGAQAANHVIESKALADSDRLGKAEKVVKGSKKKTKVARSKLGEPLVARNMFCSSCVPEEPEEVEGEVIDSDSPPATSLPLRLVATNVSTETDYSFATVINTTTDRQGSYSIDQKIPDGGAVVRISAKYVDFENEQSKRVERMSLLSTKTVPRMNAAAKPKDTKEKGKGGKNDELMAMVDEGVNKVSDTEFEIDKKVVDKILENPMSVARGARIVPSIKNGKANGFKLYAIRPSSVYAKIGLMNGDTIHSINGFDLTSPDKALEVYTKVRSASSLAVNATRRGKPISLNYSIK